MHQVRSDIVRSMLSRTFDLVTEIDRALDRQSLDATVLGAASKYGVSNYIVGIAPAILPKLEERPALILSGGWPEKWSQRYHVRNYVERDPVIRHVLTHSRPLSWRNVQGEVINEAAEFGLGDGLTVVQHSIDGLRICNSFAGPLLDDDPSARAALLFISAAASSRAIALSTPSLDATVRLTLRERECLLWLVEGKTDWEISTILCISEKTVQTHMENLRRKLNANSRTQAAVRAIRLGLIT